MRDTNFKAQPDGATRGQLPTTGPVARGLFVVHLGATLFMVGLIWFVQVVHYPLFDGVGGERFPAYEQRHTAWTTFVVGPPMLLEAATAVLLFWSRPPCVRPTELAAGLTLLAAIWASTAFVQVPCHDALSRGFDTAIHERLVGSNWARTVAWSLRGALVLRMTWRAL